MVAFLEKQFGPTVADKARATAAAWTPFDPKSLQSASDLRAWVGHHPGHAVKGYTLFEVPALDGRLRALFGDEWVKVLHWMTEGEDVREEKGWLLVEGCLRKSCEDDHYAVAIDTRTYGILACVVRQRFLAKGDNGVWVGTDRQRVARTVSQTNDTCTVTDGPKTIEAVLKGGSKPR